MEMRFPTVFLAAALGGAATAAPQPVEISNGPGAVALLELYTSEGCSSCPPGEKWLSGLVGSDRLWRDVVPVAFHVDYWDNLGWPDLLSSRRHTDRQQRYASEWGSATIYTPGFVLGGREWRSSRRDLDEFKPGAPAGRLRATGELPGRLGIEFTSGSEGPWITNVAILGGGIEVDVKRGENAGRRLRHDFAVLEWKVARTDADGRAVFEFPALPDTRAAKRLAVAVWIERPDSPLPVQAAGGWLELANPGANALQ